MRRRVERHPPTHAHAFVYVLEGFRRDAAEGWTAGDMTAGQSFYEGPEDVHVVDRNASSTQPAKFLVLLIKDKGARRSCPHSDCYGNPRTRKVRRSAGDKHDLTSPHAPVGRGSTSWFRRATRCGSARLKCWWSAMGCYRCQARCWATTPTRPSGRPGWRTCSCRRTCSSGR